MFTSVRKPVLYGVLALKIRLSNLNKMLTRCKAMKTSSLQYLARPGGHRLAFRSTLGGNPGVIFCPGFQSNMGGMKALALEEYCQRKGLSFIRFDYLGCGESEGDLREVIFSDWRDDTLTVLNHLTTGPQVMVGSSMGSWLMLLTALRQPHRIHSLIGVASAPDFNSRRGERFNSEALEELRTKGETLLPSDFGHYVITQRFLDELDQYNLLHLPSIPITCPVTLIHGMHDTAVPFQLSLNLATKLQSDDVRVILRKKGNHRLSEPEDIQILLEQLDNLIYGPKDVLCHI